MKTASEVDEALKVKTAVSEEGTDFYDVLEPPFRIYGVFYENGKFRRIPEETAKITSEGVYTLHANTSGGRVRFKTDSPFVTVFAKMSGICKMPHFPLTGSAGFDLYIKENGKESFFGTFIPPFDIENGYKSRLDFGTNEFREITVNFPLYSNVDRLFIGIKEGSQILPHSDYRTEKPVVFYGSSITQGGCASRPGNAYPAMLSRRFDFNFINLGFSGSGKAEQAIADHIASLDMSVFVYDYDHNSPDCNHLKGTHQRMFETVRKKNPDLPVIMLTSTTMERFFDNRSERKNIIWATYENAVAKGDSNVYFIDANSLFEGDADGATVEGCHPNDLGFKYLADAIDKVMEKLI